MLLRASRAGDLDALRAFIARCSPETLYRRFHGTGPRAIDRELTRIASPADDHQSWVVVDGGDMVGVLSIRDIVRVWTSEGATSGMTPPENEQSAA